MQLRRPLQEFSRPEVIDDELFHLASAFRIVAAGLIQKGGARFRRLDLDGLGKKRFRVWQVTTHGSFLSDRALTLQCVIPHETCSRILKRIGGRPDRPHGWFNCPKSQARA